MNASFPGQPRQIRAFALVRRAPSWGSALRVREVVVAEMFEPLGGAYVHELVSGLGHFVPFSRLSQTMNGLRDKVRKEFRGHEKSASTPQAGGPLTPAAA